MTSWRRLRLGLVLLAATAVTTSAATQPGSPAPAERAAVAAPRPVAPAPQYIRDRITELGKSFDGRVGIAVRSIDEGWAVGWKADELYPQQSVSKLWVSITALDAVDKGRVRLDDRVTLTRDDLTLFHQPIAALILGGGYTTSLDDLMFKAITTSDNTANDKLMRSVGGPEAVRAMIKEKRLGSIRFYNGERALQSRIAGLSTSASSWVSRPRRAAASSTFRVLVSRTCGCPEACTSCRYCAANSTSIRPPAAYLRSQMSASPFSCAIA